MSTSTMETTTEHETPINYPMLNPSDQNEAALMEDVDSSHPEEIQKKSEINLKLYQEIPAGYYYQAMMSGSPIQRVWHRKKFEKVIARIEPEWDVLDIGCGPGSLLSLMPQRPGRTVGVDIADKQIAFAKKEFQSKGFEWYREGFPRLNFEDNSFDCILMVELIEHLSQYDLAPYLREVKRILRPGGKIILTTPNYLSLWPAVEVLLGMLSPISYEEQHITKFTLGRMRTFLNYLGFTSYRMRTFFVLAPFFAYFGDSVVRKVMRLEERLFPRAGQLIVVEIDG